MAWHIQTNYKDKWEVFSTVISDVLASFKTEDELKMWIVKQELYRSKQRAIEELLMFPHRWVVNGKVRSGITIPYRKWAVDLKYILEEEKFKLIDEKLEELLNQPKEKKLREAITLQTDEGDQRVHQLKTIEPYFSAVESGDKTFEVREFDRDYRVGDFLALTHYDPDTQKLGKHIMRRITYMLTDPPYVSKGFVILGMVEDAPLISIIEQ